jgi:hypothetical protein
MRYRCTKEHNARTSSAAACLKPLFTRAHRVHDTAVRVTRDRGRPRIVRSHVVATEEVGMPAVIFESTLAIGAEASNGRLILGICGHEVLRSR